MRGSQRSMPAKPYAEERLVEERWFLQRHPRQTAEMRARIEDIDRRLSSAQVGTPMLQLRSPLP